MSATRKFSIMLVIVSLLVGALPMTFAQGEIESICLITDVGKVNDGTFNQFAYDGMVAAVEDFDLDSTYIETVAQTEYEGNINACVQEGYDIIVTVGFLIADATLAAAQENPDIYFIGVDQFLVDGPTNYVGIQFREDQAGFLVGVLAGLVTESNIIGGVYGLEVVPPVVRFRLGFEQGAAFIGALTGKEIEANGTYHDSFTDRVGGASIANQLIGDGADVIFGAGGPTGSGGIAEAATQGVWVIGVDQDEWFSTFGAGESEGSEFIISSAVKRVDLGVYQLTQALVEGNMDGFPGGSIYILSVANDGITYAPKHEADIPDEYYDVVEQVRTMLADGSLTTGINPETSEIEMTVEEIIDAAGDDLNLEIPEM